MNYSMEERCNKILAFCLEQKSTNPFRIFTAAAGEDFIRIHGPEHHILDGACILTAYHNAGGNIDLKEALSKMIEQGKAMPGAICGLWGVCGSVTSIGAALAIIDKTGPLTTDHSWGSHMRFTSAALYNMAEIGGPRCCKRDGFISMTEAVEFLNKHYDVEMETETITCSFYEQNEQCIQKRCPFHPEIR